MPFELQVWQINIVELEGDPSRGEDPVVFFEDEYWKYIKTFKNKKEVREYIDRKRLGERKLRMICPGGAVADPLKIKITKEGSNPKPVRTPTIKHRIAKDTEPIIMPKNPTGRMRFIKKAQETEGEGDWTIHEEDVDG
jgi:hypothetical protein